MSLQAQRGRALVAALLAVALVALALVGAAALPARAAGGPSLSVTPSTVTDPSVATTFTVTGSGFVGDGAVNGAYVLLGPASTWHGEGPLPGAGWIKQAHVPAADVVDGGFTTTLVAPAGSLTAGVAYQVASSAAHALSFSNRTLDAFAAITVSATEPTTPVEPTPSTTPTTPTTSPSPSTSPTAPVFTPSLSVFAADGTTPLGSTVVSPGDQIVVKGTGFDPTANVGGRGAPIPATLPQGTYVVLGRALDTWKPSQNAKDARAFDATTQRWALASSVLDQVPTKYQDAIRAQWAPLSADGSFTTTITVKDVTLAGGRFGVFSYAAGGTINAAQEIFVPVTLRPTLSVFKADGTTPLGSTAVSPGDQIVVKGTGFDPTANVGGRGAPIPATLPQGNYVVLGRALDAWKPSQGAPTAARKVAVQRWALASSVLDQVPSQHQATVRNQWVDLGADGSFTATLTVQDADLADGKFGVFTYAAGGTVNPAQEIFIPVTLAGATPTPEPSTPAPTTPAPTPEPTTTPTPSPTLTGTLTWGVRESFRTYIAGGGTITTSNGAGTSAGLFTFPLASSAIDSATRLGSVGYTGSVRFLAHAGGLDLTLTNPRVTVTSSSQATLVVDVASGTTVSSAVPFATLDLSAATVTSTAGALTWTGAPSRLTAAGAASAEGFYVANEPLDPVTFSVGTNTTTPTPDPTTPAPSSSTGVATINVAQVSPGGAVTIGGGGFGANEQGLTVVIRSTPRTLATNVSADASGFASATVTIPTDIPAGEHTLSIEGANHTVQVPITIVAAAPAAPTCSARAVSGATLRWGVKSTFNSYVTGPIANGAIATTGGVTASGGVYAWGGGTGSFNTDRILGSTSFRGGVTYTGHSGTLDLRLTNPRVVINGGTGTLVLDVLSTDIAGTATTKNGVTFATLSLAGRGSVAGSSASWSAVPATLTAAGADAFAGYYNAGESLDPVSFTLPLGATVACTPLTGSLSSTGANSGLMGLVALCLVGAGLGAVVVSRRRAAIA